MRSIVFILFFSILTLTSSAQFKQKKTRFKAIKSFLFHNPVEIGEIKFNTRIKLGYGLPQGVFGINGEFGLDYITFTTGFGYAKMRTTSGAFGFHVGFRGYFMSNERKLRPRISTHYGLNNIYNEAGVNTPTYGPSAGIGFEHKVSDFIVYDLEYTFIINPLNSYRPAQKSLENIALPQLGVGIYF